LEHFPVTKTDSGFLIEGFPEAVKVVRIDGRQSKRLADLALHRADLEFAAECLKTINLVSDKPGVLRQALWRAAIIHYMKCFGHSGARFQLSAERIYKGNTPALVAFSYFKELRDRHFVHDENSHAQSVPGAILNRRDKPYKIEKIVCFSVMAETLGQDNYNNLHLLVQTAQTWVVNEFDALCQTLTKELEAKSYDELDSREPITYKAPTIDEIGKNRNAP
jgi:hypothetical protein